MKTKYFSWNESEEFKKFIYEHPKTAITSISKDLLVIDYKNVTFTKLNERVIIDYYVLSFFFASVIFVPSFKAKIIQMYDCGFISKYADDLVFRSLPARSASGPTVFTLEHLSAGFYAFVFFLIVSLVVFLLEFPAYAIKAFIERKKRPRFPKPLKRQNAARKVHPLSKVLRKRKGLKRSIFYRFKKA